jgi:methylmalonyl-CoA mutase
MAQATFEDWKAAVTKELAGAAFDKLVATTAEGIAIQPLYTEARVEPGLPGAAPYTRGALAATAVKPFKICMRVDAQEVRREGAIEEDLEGGADALWVPHLDHEAEGRARQRGLPTILEGISPNAPVATTLTDRDALRALKHRLRELEPAGGAPQTAQFWSSFDHISATLRGWFVRDGLPDMVRSLVPMALDMTRDWRPGIDGGLVRVSGLAFHEAGADAADELALMLASAAAYLRALTDGGLALDTALRTLWTQISVGRDTFGELCKLRALRVCWHKLAVAAGAGDVPPPMLHAVCSTRAQSQRDPWVNMLRVTTEVFAAALGGADYITPLAFDEALGPASAAGRREARNAALVLREESLLGRVIDPAGGSYYLETRTDQLAREAWRRFTEIEREGGIVPMIASGKLTARLQAAWAKRAAAIAKRKEPVLGVSEFANLSEKLPVPAAAAGAHATGAHAAGAQATGAQATGANTTGAQATGANATGANTAGAQATGANAATDAASKRDDRWLPFTAHRDGEAFEALRTRVEAAPPKVALILLGPPSEHRARLGYAAALFATAGVRAEEIPAPEVGGGGALGEAIARLDVACICGSDERYAAEAVAHASELRAAGARKIVLAGRPGAPASGNAASTRTPREREALEADLRTAGVTAFIYVGCDVLATLTELLS